jgi:primosomal protein N'
MIECEKCEELFTIWENEEVVQCHYCDAFNKLF